MSIDEAIAKAESERDRLKADMAKAQRAVSDACARVEVLKILLMFPLFP